MTARAATGRLRTAGRSRATTGGGDVALVIQNATHGHTADVLELTSGTLLVVQNTAHAHSADNVTLLIGGALIIHDSLHAHTADNLVLAAVAALVIHNAFHGHTASNLTLSTGGGSADLALALKIILNRKELNPTTGKYTVYDDDGVTPLLRASAWVDPAGTIPYAGGLVQRVDRLEPV